MGVGNVDVGLARSAPQARLISETSDFVTVASESLKGLPFDPSINASRGTGLPRITARTGSVGGDSIVRVAPPAVGLSIAVNINTSEISRRFDYLGGLLISQPSR